MRIGFWRGIIAGGIMGIVAGMMMGPQRKPAPKGLWKMAGGNRIVKSRANRVIKGVSKTVNNLIK